MTDDAPECEVCGTTENLTFGPDPYSHELHGDDTPYWLCEDCARERYLET